MQYTSYVVGMNIHIKSCRVRVYSLKISHTHDDLTTVIFSMYSLVYVHKIYIQ